MSLKLKNLVRFFPFFLLWSNKTLLVTDIYVRIACRYDIRLNINEQTCWSEWAGILDCCHQRGFRVYFVTVLMVKFISIDCFMQGNVTRHFLTLLHFEGYLVVVLNKWIDWMDWKFLAVPTIDEFQQIEVESTESFTIESNAVIYYSLKYSM